MLTVMAAPIDHIRGKTGNIIDLLVPLTDDQLEDQRLYFKDQMVTTGEQNKGFASHKWSNMVAACQREQEFRRHRSMPVE